MDLSELVAEKMRFKIEPSLRFPSIYDDVVESIIFEGVFFEVPKPFYKLQEALYCLSERCCGTEAWNIITKYLDMDTDTFQKDTLLKLDAVFEGVDLRGFRRSFCEYLQEGGSRPGMGQV